MTPLEGMSTLARLWGLRRPFGRKQTILDNFMRRSGGKFCVNTKKKMVIPHGLFYGQLAFPQNWLQHFCL
jgi:hypothetical protein